MIIRVKDIELQNNVFVSNFLLITTLAVQKNGEFREKTEILRAVKTSVWSLLVFFKGATATDRLHVRVKGLHEMYIICYAF